MTLRPVFAAAAVGLALATASAAGVGGYLFLNRPPFKQLGGVRNLDLVRAYLFDPKVRRFAAALREEDPQVNAFKTMWDTNVGVLLSRRLFREVDMDGAPKYAYRANLKKLSFVVQADDLMWKLEAVDTPRIHAILRDVDTTYQVEASYDGHGFRHVDADLTTGCTRHVLFLGDSFTDGLWVKDGETFANLYGRLARAEGVAVCPVNAGVNGYGSLEERFVLEHDFEAAGCPSLVFVMYFPNDVDWDFNAVVDGTLKDSERLWRASLTELSRMHRFAAEHHSVLVLVAIPPAAHVFNRTPQTHYEDVLRTFAKQEGVPFINLYQDFVARDPQPLYLPWDPHFAPEGHREVAKLLYEKTRELLK